MLRITAAILGEERCQGMYRGAQAGISRVLERGNKLPPKKAVPRSNRTNIFRIAKCLRAAALLCHEWKGVWWGWWRGTGG